MKFNAMNYTSLHGLDILFFFLLFLAQIPISVPLWNLVSLLRAIIGGGRVWSRGSRGKGRWGTGGRRVRGRLSVAFGLALKDEQCGEGTG